MVKIHPTFTPFLTHPHQTGYKLFCWPYLYIHSQSLRFMLYHTHNMRHLAVRSNLVDLVSVAEKENNDRESARHPICPKPRRIQSTTHEFLKQHRCGGHSHPNTNDERSVILNLPADKVESRESTCVGCSLSCYPGSPPSRSENPLVHDVQFVRQMELLSPFTRSNLSDKFAIASVSPI